MTGMISQEWVLDMLGNWVTSRKDLSGDGDYLDTGSGGLDVKDEREHNQANEIVERDLTGPNAGTVKCGCPE